METQELLNKIMKVEQELSALKQEYYKNNFTSNQDFAKYSNFTTMLKLPSYSTRPATCQVGELIESSGKAYICSATNTWTVVGTQT